MGQSFSSFNPVASKPKSLATSLSLMYACRSQTSSLSKAELKVELFLSVSSRACKVPTSTEATLNVSSFFATSAWRRWNANYGSLGSLVGPYSKLKVEWMKDLASTSLIAKSSTLLHTSAQLTSNMALSSSLVWP